MFPSVSADESGSPINLSEPPLRGCRKEDDISHHNGPCQPLVRVVDKAYRNTGTADGNSHLRQCINTMQSNANKRQFLETRAGLIHYYSVNWITTLNSLTDKTCSAQPMALIARQPSACHLADEVYRQNLPGGGST
jgi:hypothetical protein